MNGDNGTSTQAPQMRALLFTDLCDSLILVERIGDAAAAELFQAHDRLVLVLQQQWNGRLIDRSDGLLLLFERAIDGLGFALDYQRGLQEITTAGPARIRVHCAPSFAAQWLSPQLVLWLLPVALPMVLPPTVVGYYLIVLVGRQGPLGRWLESSFGITLLFT